METQGSSFVPDGVIPIELSSESDRDVNDPLLSEYIPKVGVSWPLQLFYVEILNYFGVDPHNLCLTVGTS
uniref:Uncharacterized protein n=1 Tax=Cannabis sativa TaxID=3483 RepID=A0A803PQE7_CANSA